MKEVQAFYDGFSNRQEKVGINDRHRSIMNILKKAGLKQNFNVLEIGSGIGTQSELILKNIKNGWLTSLDLSPKSIEIAKKRLSKFNNKTLLAIDIIEWNTNGKFDMIVLPDVLEHIPMEQHHALFLKLKQLLKPDGKIVIHIPNPYHLDYCRAQGMEMQIIDQALYLPLLIDNLKETGLFISFLEIYGIWIKEGDYQFVMLEHEEKFAVFTPIIRKVPLLKKMFYKIRCVLNSNFKNQRVE